MLSLKRIIAREIHTGLNGKVVMISPDLTVEEAVAEIVNELAIELCVEFPCILEATLKPKPKPTSLT